MATRHAGSRTLAPALCRRALLRRDGLGIILQERHPFSFQTLIRRRRERHRELQRSAGARGVRAPTRLADLPRPPRADTPMGARVQLPGGGAAILPTPVNADAHASASPPVMLEKRAPITLPLVWVIPLPAAMLLGEFHPPKINPPGCQCDPNPTGAMPWGCSIAQTPRPARSAARGCPGKGGKPTVSGKIELIKQMPGGCHSLTSRALAADLSSAGNV